MSTTNTTNTSTGDPKPKPDIEPPALADFLHTSSPDPATRTMAAAMCALSHWQVCGRTMTPTLPHMLMVNAGGAATDPLDGFADDFPVGLQRREPMDTGVGSFLGGTPEMVRTSMNLHLRLWQIMKEETPWKVSEIEGHKEVFNDAKITGFGSGRVARYAQAWDDQFEWVTGPTDELVLRLNQPADHEAFRRDVLTRPWRLLEPPGLSVALTKTTKSVVLSGSLNGAQWDEAIVQKLVGLGLPVLFLPHLAQTPLWVSDRFGMGALGATLAHRDWKPLVAAIHLPATDWFVHYEELLRARLHTMPTGYEFSVLQVVHQLGKVCARIAQHHATPDMPRNVISAMYMDLHAMAFRGIVIGVTGLAYHCLGFEAGCPRETAVKMLHHLRATGPLRRRDIQRKFPHIIKEQRDDVLERLAAEGLLTLEGREVTAVSLADFVRSLHASPEFPEPDYLCPPLLGEMGLYRASLSEQLAGGWVGKVG
jgi:hypothetical protein